jgi:hypothetical protein
MKSHLTQLGDCLPGLWEEIQAESPVDAVAAALRRNGILLRPAAAYVALGEARHPNGAPIAVQRFGITYGDENKKS